MLFKRFVKRWSFISAMLVIAVIFTGCGVSDSGKENADAYKVGDTVVFGTYPQSAVIEGGIVAALGNYNPEEWKSYGYYFKGEISDYMYYIDKEYEGEKYRGVYFTTYRATNCGEYANATIQPDNGYFKDIVYWFKYEPVKWTVTEVKDGSATLVSELVLDSQHFGSKTSSVLNNYAESEIRQWLNGPFYSMLLNDGGKELIRTVTVDNSAASTGSDNPFACENTEDKIYLLSYSEKCAWFGKRNEMLRKPTEYAKCQGVLVDSVSGGAWFSLRSPSPLYEKWIKTVDFWGTMNYLDADFTYCGILPVLSVKI